MNQQHIDEINAWLNSDRVYQTGVKLFDQHSKNKTLKNLFPRKEIRYAGKLAYELGKIAGIAPTVDKVEGRELKPSGLKPDTTIRDDYEPLIADDSDQPPIIRRIIAEFSAVYKNRSTAHNSLKGIPPDNRAENVAMRQVIVEKMAGYSSRMEELHAAHQDWLNKNILPEENLIYPPKPPKVPKVGILPLEELSRQRLNLQKSLSRDNNLLYFGTPTKQPMVSEMRPGPKRNELLKRIKEKKAEIENLITKIDGLNQSLGTPAGSIQE